MRRTIIDDARVLRVHDVGESDRFCILLTQSHGRIAARAQGVRKLSNRRSVGLLPLCHVRVELEEHSYGWIVRGAERSAEQSATWQHAQAFAIASEGAELVLRLTQDADPIPEVFLALSDHIQRCMTGHTVLALETFAIRLLSALGFLPSVWQSCVSGSRIDALSMAYSMTHGGFVATHEDPHADPLSAGAARFLRAIVMQNDDLPLDATDIRSVGALVQKLLGSQLGMPLSSTSVRLALSMPTCHVTGRASYTDDVRSTDEPVPACTIRYHVARRPS